MDIIGFETSQSVQQLSRAWNQKTQHWLENYTYKRIKGSRLKQQVITYAVSAFWHGLEIGFYFFFLTIPFLDMAREEMRAKVRPYFVSKDADGKETPKSTKLVYDFLSWVANQFLCNLITLPFLVMQLASAVEILKIIMFVPHIIILVTLVVLKLLPDPAKKIKKA